MANKPRTAKITDTWNQLVQDAEVGTAALLSKLQGAEQERDKLKADFDAHLDQDKQAKAKFVDLISRIQGALVLVFMISAVLVTLHYAPAQEGRQVAGAGFTHSLTQS